MPPGTALEISAAAITVACDSSSEQVPVAEADYSYTLHVSFFGKGTNAVSTYVTTSAGSRSLYIAPYTFPPLANLTIILNVTSSSGAMSSASTSLRIPHGVVTASIAGGSRTNPESSALALDASGSRDTSYSDGGLLAYSWSCLDITNTTNRVPVSFRPVASAYYTRTSGDIPSGKTYLFTVTVSTSDGRMSSASVAVTQATTPIPVITFGSVSKHNPGEKLTLQAAIGWDANPDDSTVNSTVDFSWSVTNSDGSSLGPASFKSSPSGSLFEPSQAPLVLKPGALSSGSWLATLTARFLSTGASAVSSTTIEVNAPPYGGDVEILGEANTNTGEALTTLFVLRAPYWTDPDGGLAYWYGYYYDSGEIAADNVVQLRDYSPDSSAYVYLPPGNVTLLCKIKDLYGAYSEARNTAIVSQPASISSALTTSASLVDEAISGGDRPAALAVIASTAEVLKSVDCSLSPDCSALNRFECGEATGYSKGLGGTNACGDCLPGFLGSKVSGKFHLVDCGGFS